MKAYLDIVKKVLEEGEKVLWEGRPQFRPFIMSGILSPVTLFGIFWMIFMIK